MSMYRYKDGQKCKNGFLKLIFWHEIALLL